MFEFNLDDANTGGASNTLHLSVLVKGWNSVHIPEGHAKTPFQGDVVARVQLHVGIIPILPLSVKVGTGFGSGHIQLEPSCVVDSPEGIIYTFEDFPEAPYSRVWTPSWYLMIHMPETVVLGYAQWFRVVIDTNDKRPRVGVVRLLEGQLDLDLDLAPDPHPYSYPDPPAHTRLLGQIVSRILPWEFRRRCTILALRIHIQGPPQPNMTIAFEFEHPGCHMFDMATLKDHETLVGPTQPRRSYVVTAAGIRVCDEEDDFVDWDVIRDPIVPEFRTLDTTCSTTPAPRLVIGEAVVDSDLLDSSNFIFRLRDLEVLVFVDVLMEAWTPVHRGQPCT
jgi:hypothetical protein